jgi:flagellin
MTVINTNTAALRAQNGTRMANQQLQVAMERLSTGKRINSAKDDAAGLAIASSMTSQIRGMGQAVRNANDGISMAQSAEGALSEVTNMLQRVRELAIQSASGTYQASDRANLNAEATALQSQVTDILSNSKYNGVALFDYAATDTASDDVTIQVGANTETVAITKPFLDSDDFQAADFAVDTVANANTTVTNVDAALTTINTARANLGASQSRLESVVNNLTNNLDQPVRCTFADRRRRFLGRDDEPRQGADPQHRLDGDAGPGQPEQPGRPEPAPLSLDILLKIGSPAGNCRALFCAWDV